MKTVALAGAELVAQEAAAFIAAEARAAIHARGRFLMALSGGTTPMRMLDQLASEEVPWARVHVFQVDERIVAATNPARSLTMLREHLLDKVAIPAGQVHAMPVEGSDLAAAAAQYAAILDQVAGKPPVLDLIHLGLGEDGHTASLVPGDPVLDDLESPVALTGLYQGFRRMTLTYATLGQARRILWLVTGSDKAKARSHLQAGDPSIPAGRVPSDRAILFTDLAER
jgi:6-phosphogluconolactonase